MHLSAVHAAWTEHRRVFELRALLKAIARHQPGPHALVGDFNTLAPGELLDIRKLPARLRALVWLGARVPAHTLDAAAARGAETDELARVFPTLPSISIDHGVLEKASGLAVVPGDFGWSDVGSWESAWELSPKDAASNAAPAGSVLVEARGNLVRDLTTDGRRRVVALVGVDDLVVVQTDDALLVMPRRRAQDVRLAVDALRAAGRDDAV